MRKVMSMHVKYLLYIPLLFSLFTGCVGPKEANYTYYDYSEKELAELRAALANYTYSDAVKSHTSPQTLEAPKEKENVNESDLRGWSKLHQAAYDGNVWEIKRLLDNGAYIHAKDRDGKTPIMAAAMKCSFDAFDYLAKHGARYNEDISNKKATAVDYARENRCKKITDRAPCKFKPTQVTNLPYLDFL